MVQEVEGEFVIRDQSLYTKTWLPDGPPVAKLIFFHGFSDHVGRYYGFFPTLASRGIAVYGIDQRGWGKSVKTPAQKGLTGPTQTVISDMAAFILDKLPSDVPVFVLGHSMGGGQVATLASMPQYDDLAGQIRGWILEAPFIAFSPQSAPNMLTVVSGKLAASVLPTYKLVRNLPPEHLCRDPDVQRSIHDDPLLHNTGTLEGLAGMLQRTAALSNGTLQLSHKVRSLLHVHGNDDRVCSFSGAKAWYNWQARTVEDATFSTYDGFFHQLHADPGKERLYDEVSDWILARSQADSSKL